MSKFSREVTNAVRDKRRDMGLMQCDLAEVLDVSRSKIAKIEAGNASYSLDELSIIAQYFKCSVKEIIPDGY
jgi:transcriptional regulator with XRE-family HTH domain